MYSTVFVPGYGAMAQNVGGAAIGSGDGPLLNLEVPQHDYQDVVCFREGSGVRLEASERDVGSTSPFRRPVSRTKMPWNGAPHPNVISMTAPSNVGHRTNTGRPSDSTDGRHGTPTVPWPDVQPGGVVDARAAARRGESIPKACVAGLETARRRPLTWHREHRHDHPTPEPDDVG